ncbi:hypothetical protein LINPERPRIM_LOCUS8691 [Linum perenne]
MAARDHHIQLIVTLSLVFLLLIHPSLSIPDGFRVLAAAHQGNVEMMDVELDYAKDPGANTKHLPGPKTPRPGVVG